LGVIRRRRSRENQDRDSQKGRVNGDLEAVAVDGEHVEVGTGVSMATDRRSDEAHQRLQNLFLN
jgi:hypothetical protein